MNEASVIQKVLSAYRSTFGGGAEIKATHAVYCKDNMSRSKTSVGWKVFLSLDVPEGFSPDSITAEYYEDTDEVEFLMAI